MHIAWLQHDFNELNHEIVKTQLPNLLFMSRIMSTLPIEFKSMWESVPVQERTINKFSEHLRLIEMRLPGKQAEYSALVVSITMKKNMHKN